MKDYTPHARFRVSHYSLRFGTWQYQTFRIPVGVIRWLLFEKDDPGRHLGFQCLRGNLPHSVFCYSFFVQLLVCLPESPTDWLTLFCLSVCLSIYLTDLIYLSALVPFCLSICLLSCGVCHAVLLSAMLPVWRIKFLSTCLIACRFGFPFIRYVYTYIYDQQRGCRSPWTAVEAIKTEAGRHSNGGKQLTSDQVSFSQKYFFFFGGGGELTKMRWMN